MQMKKIGMSTTFVLGGVVESTGQTTRINVRLPQTDRSDKKRDRNQIHSSQLFHQNKTSSFSTLVQKKKAFLQLSAPNLPTVFSQLIFKNVQLNQTYPK